MATITGSTSVELVLEALQPQPLSDLRTGDRARLERADLCCEDCELLTAMGMTDRCELRVCRGGAPCIVEINATRLGLSASVADRILVRPLHR
jgi:Fe2+ transport system protein FeoA